jgi:hypothetical protein
MFDERGAGGLVGRFSAGALTRRRFGLAAGSETLRHQLLSIFRIEILGILLRAMLDRGLVFADDLFSSEIGLLGQ